MDRIELEAKAKGVTPMNLSLNQIRARFAKCAESAYKQMGLRAVKDAIALGDRNPEHAAGLRLKALHYLQYAEAIR